MQVRPQQAGSALVWAPQPGSQTLFVSCPIFECLYEGTRGPGKSIALLMSFSQHCGRGHGAAWRGIIFRRQYKELADLVTKAKQWFRPVFPGIRFLEGTGNFRWIWPTGEELLFRVGVKFDDYWDYHGHEYPFVGFDELCTWADPAFYLAMHSCCRSSQPNMPRMVRADANPYGPGHGWVKDRFRISTVKSGTVILDEADGRPRVRIHGSIWENRILLASDPDYLKTLQAETDPNRRKAWLEGSWDIVAGGMFDGAWDTARHVIERLAIPPTWRIDRAFDWGSSAPFSVGWWAESDGEAVAIGNNRLRKFPRGTLIRIAEWYGWNGKPNQGLRMIDTAIAKGIVEREEALGFKGRVQPGPGDASIFDVENGVCIGTNMAQLGATFVRSVKSKGSRKNGWELMRARLVAGKTFPLEEPALFVFDNCDQFIRTIPSLPRSEDDPDDIDDTAEDHVADECRYRVLAAAQGVYPGYVGV